jgi:hypothetical protein
MLPRGSQHFSSPHPLWFRPHPSWFRGRLFFSRPRPLRYRPRPFIYRPRPFTFRPRPFIFCPRPFLFRPRPFLFRPRPFTFRPRPSDRVVIPCVQRPFGRRTGRAGRRPCPLCLIWTGRGTVDGEITIPNLLYCGNFSYCWQPTWQWTIWGGSPRNYVGRQREQLRAHARTGMGANMLGANMYWARTCRAQTCTGRQHVGRKHVPGANMSGANLTPFFSKNTPKLPFLVEEAQMNFFLFFFCTFNHRILP